MISCTSALEFISPAHPTVPQRISELPQTLQECYSFGNFFRPWNPPRSELSSKPSPISRFPSNQQKHLGDPASHNHVSALEMCFNEVLVLGEKESLNSNLSWSQEIFLQFHLKMIFGGLFSYKSCMTPHLDKLQAEFALLLICTHMCYGHLYFTLRGVRSQKVLVLAETSGF